MNFKNFGTVLIGLIFNLNFAFSQQDVEIKLGPDEVALNQVYTISVTVKNQKIKGDIKFPEIPGFDGRGKNQSFSSYISNNKTSFSTSITMNYYPRKEGTFTLKPFVITVNGMTYKSNGKTIKVGPRKQRSRQNSSPFGSDPFDDFFGRRNTQQEFVEVEADAFFALSTNKSEVFRGEGVTATLAFYVSNSNRAVLRFHDLGNQVNEIVKLIKPANCWEENFNIDNITGEPITLGDEQYTQYKIYQATYFPLNNEDLKFPSIPLKMIKYKVAKNPSFFGKNKEEDYQTFRTKEKTIKVKELPDHPLKESVAVGNFRLREKIDKTELNTGQSFSYNFDIGGIGNISAINPPEAAGSEDIEIYDPAVKQTIQKNNGKVTGTKEFEFYGVPNEPGEYKLSDYFSWVYFNTSTKSYDTLVSNVVLKVNGESKKNQFIMANDLGSFYDKADLQDNSLVNLNSVNYLQILINVLIVVMIVVGIFYLIKGIKVRRSTE